MLEPAFYGGTFTCLSASDLALCFEFIKTWQGNGVFGPARCSTRPDFADEERLAPLRPNGFHLVELGVQSFSDKALSQSGRGYTGETAEKACKDVRRSGLKLGIQLMPGMPGCDRETAEDDVSRAILLQPDCVRLYPCLVLQGTPLAAMWQTGRFEPWPLGETIDFLALALKRFRENGIPVIRMGLAPQAGMNEAILAGPAHPALGGRASARALGLYLADIIAKAGPRFAISPDDAEAERLILHAPRKHQGEFFGNRRELVPFYEALGLPAKNIRWWDEPHFKLGREAKNG